MTQPDDIETKWRKYWEQNDIYRYDPARGRSETFVVDTPPPTVSGSLHLGHVFSYTHIDLVARYQRMRGDNIFFPMGWDDNGLPTERRVQNVFNVRCDPSLPYDPGLVREWGEDGELISVSRQNFIELCDRVVAEDEAKFMELWQRLGISIDWNETYATIDRRCRFLSQYSFLKLVEKGEAEVREAPTMWDVDFGTAVAQAELEDRERGGLFYRVRFGVDGGGDVTIATTRPELIPACIAVMTHPDDDRFNHLIGKTAITPLFGAPVPILADDEVDPSKGTGIMMVCTFGDVTDVERWRELGVPAREVIGRDGRIVDAPWGQTHWTSTNPETARRHHSELTGLYVNQARKRIHELLVETGAAAGEPEPTTQYVKYYERGERPLEFVVTRQWFVRLLDKKDKLLEQGRKITWHPGHFRKRYEDWVEGLNQDWCVSRQRYFGVPIPVWYAVGSDGKADYSRLILPRSEDLPVDPSVDAPPGFSEEQRGRPGGFVGDPDVFDTWATSSLTPLVPTGWPHDDARFRALYPNDLRPQSHEIIRTWAFYTIARAFMEDGSIPWHHVAISGWVLDPERKKMSKSKGNVIVPTEPLDEYGADAVRYWSASARLGVDTATDYKVMREGKRLVTKMRNAARLIQAYEGESDAPEHPIDRALVGRLRRLVEDATARWDDWDHAGALDLTETWFWSDLCDNYLELSKARAYAGNVSAVGTLRTALDVALRLFAPYLPYITEEIYNSTRSSPTSIHRSGWPRPDELPSGDDDGCFDAAVAVLTQVRRAKSEAKKSVRWPVEHMTVRLAPGTPLHHAVIEDIKSTLNVTEVELIENPGVEELVVETRLAADTD
jgi:valyl-tRNA synthetase